MEIREIIDGILSLVADAKFSIWEGEPPFSEEDDPSVTRFIRFGRTVCWNKTNVQPCPSEDEILNIITST